jgi:hypothetical protein
VRIGAIVKFTRARERIPRLRVHERSETPRVNVRARAVANRSTTARDRRSWTRAIAETSIVESHSTFSRARR